MTPIKPIEYYEGQKVRARMQCEVPGCYFNYWGQENTRLYPIRVNKGDTGIVIKVGQMYGWNETVIILLDDKPEVIAIYDDWYGFEEDIDAV